MIPIDEQIEYMESIVATSLLPTHMPKAILASLEELTRIHSAEMPVEPPEIQAAKVDYPCMFGPWITYIDALKAKLQAAQQELLDTTWQDHADHWKKRAEQAEKDRDACYASLEATRSKLHEITAFVNDNASPQRESEQERDAFARAIRERSAK